MGQIQYITACMTQMDSLWLSNPTQAYGDWQVREAAGADGRPFSARSIVQHQAMFEHFRRHLLARGTTIASFGTADVDAFWQTHNGRTYSQATRMRYVKLLDRLCRHLVFTGVRQDNPAAALLSAERWPDQEPTPQFLTEAVDARLQAYLQSPPDDLASLRSQAIVAAFLGTGITAAEARAARCADLWPDATPPYLVVRAHGLRDARTVHLASFAVPPLRAWSTRRAALAIEGELLFTLTPEGLPITDMSFGRIVSEILNAIGATNVETSPRTLRNTFCRRQLLAGQPRDEVSQMLGLASNRTCDRIFATIHQPTI
ncbi:MULTISPECIES: tyrosine-type recombinase/integrase [Cupriavidus]|uniref:Integrase/recombinase n=3 Tax=Cupriavidus TaxID=106589 RepID=A0A375GNA8_9BURK|nr:MULTISPECIES: tyrosine-type recombinase/integrase [Cupriavidus]MCO4865878.1 tyrosine-type recombinase/integrase [Cupriavidus sp. WGlv3]MCO4893365.1 tyrosine-type recombinase/integrase [Cupriavidus sp. WGtm5]ULX56059.1 integrase [Cupriavidus taiwanensis]CAP63833.1 integrase/recombinase [Cupriavidus taiwanensis LMG 19424]SOY74007.1 integrase/recombinase [Cupriavidus taiwanensis]